MKAVSATINRALHLKYKLVFPSFAMRSPGLLKIVLVCLLSIPAAFAQADARGEGSLNPAQPVGITPDQIIQKFAAREAQFAQARDQYAYREIVKIEVLDGDTVTGEFQETFDSTFDDQGNRLMNIVYAPPSTLENGGLSLDEEDIQDFENLEPFVLTTADLAQYNVSYLGQQHEDELNTYVFDISPKQIDKKIRRFQGRIWVDDHDFQIVKAYGKGVSEKNFEKKSQHVFPDFTTYRQQVDGDYWFPTYTIADTVFHFPATKNSFPRDVHFREVVRYTNYQRFGAKHRIIYQGQDLPPTPPKK